MILPTKHLPLNRSLLKIGAEILEILNDRPQSVSTTWEQLRYRNSKTSFEQFTLAASFLFVVGGIEFTGDNLRKKTR